MKQLINILQGNAQVLRRIEAVEKSLQSNTKMVVPAGSDLTNVIGDLVQGCTSKINRVII